MGKEKAVGRDRDERTTVLVGNPNVGKSVVFSSLTGRYREISNYPGTTVEVSVSHLPGDEKEIVIDTPGVNSLIPHSEDEKVTRNILLESGADRIIQVADAKNLKRALMLFVQFAELEVPMLLVLNMMDEARTRSIHIDTEALSKELGVPVCPTVAPEGRGIKDVKREMKNAKIPAVKPDYPPHIGQAIRQLTKIFGNRRMAFLYLAASDETKSLIREKRGREKEAAGSEILAGLHREFSQDLGYMIAQSSRKKAEGIYSRCVRKEKIEKTTLKKKISDLTLRPLTGIPIFLGVLYLLYLFVGYVGAQLIVDFMETVLFGEYVNPFVRDAVYGLAGQNVLTDILVGEYGVFTVGIAWSVAIILPVITTFFLAFSLLEDCGYIPRLAAMADKLFRRVGLNGKAVLPMVLGFGCDTMAIMTARTLDTKKEKTIATLILALGIPCSAQLGVIFAVMALVPITFFYLWVLVIASQLLLVAWLSSKLIPGGRGDFIMELPPIRVPQWGNVLAKTYHKVAWFFKEVVPFFMVGDTAGERG